MSIAAKRTSCGKSGSTITSFFSASPKSKPAPIASPSLEDLLEDDTDALGALVSPIKSVNSPIKKRPSQTVMAKPSPSKRAKLKEDDMKQWSLDLGQKDTSLCSECGMLFSTASEVDRDAHRVYHRAKTAKLKIAISATMELLYTNPKKKSHQIVLLGQKDLAKERIQNLLEAVDRDLQLGLCEEESKEHEKIFVYLVDGYGAGVVRAEKIENAFRLMFVDVGSDLPAPLDGNLDTSVSSTSTATSKAGGDDVLRYNKRAEPAMLGISRIWVREEYKRQGIASLLLDTARAHFSFGGVVPKAMCAMTQPTMEGRQFSSQYFGTRSYLVYEADSTNRRKE